MPHHNKKLFKVRSFFGEGAVLGIEPKAWHVLVK